jgi:hypothetical protein
VARLIEVAWHLDGKPPAGGEETSPSGQDVQVIRDPLQDSVGDDHVGPPIRLPLPHVSEREAEPRAGPARHLRAGIIRRMRHEQCLRIADHLRRAVDAADLSLRPAPGQRGGQVARPAAQVYDQPGSISPDPREHVSERPRPLVGEKPVLARIPHGSLQLS